LPPQFCNTYQNSLLKRPWKQKLFSKSRSYSQ